MIQKSYQKPRIEDAQTCILMAKIAKQIGRYDFMIECVNLAIEKGRQLNEKQKLVVCAAYKQAIDKKKDELLKLQNFSGREAQFNHVASSLAEKIKQEIVSDCNKLINIFRRKEKLNSQSSDEDDEDQFPILALKSPEIRSFYYKLIADHCRYVLRYDKTLADTSEFAKTLTRTQRLYRKALKLADKSSFSASRLGMVLNYSVFLYEFKKDEKKAHDICSTEVRQYETALAETPSVELSPNLLAIVDKLQSNLYYWEN